MPMRGTVDHRHQRNAGHLFPCDRWDAARRGRKNRFNNQSQRVKTWYQLTNNKEFGPQLPRNLNVLIGVGGGLERPQH